MMIPLTWLVAVPLALHGGAAALAPSVAVRAGTPDSGVVALTPQLIGRYGAVRTAAFAFLEVHPDVASAVPERRYPVTLRGPGGKAQGRDTLTLPDFAALAARDPQVAAIFSRYDFVPAQFGVVTVTMRAALFAAECHFVYGWANRNPDEVVRKNTTLAVAHEQEFIHAGIDPSIAMDDPRGDLTP